MRYLPSAIISSIVCWIGLFSRFGLSAFQPDRLAVEIILGSIGTIVIVLGALPPFLASRWLARRLHVSSIYYDAGCGAVAGFMFGPVMFPLLPNLATTGVPDTPFWDGYHASLVTTGLPFFIGGAVGGIVYRIISTRWPTQ